MRLKLKPLPNKLKVKRRELPRKLTKLRLNTKTNRLKLMQPESNMMTMLRR